MLNFQVLSTFAPCEMVLIPLLQNDSLKEILTEIATFAGIESDTLIADFKADKKEILSFYPNKNQGINLPKKISLAGLGKVADFSPEILRQVMRFFIHKHKATLTENFSVDLLTFSSLKSMEEKQQRAFTEAIAAGSLLGMYEIAQLKAEKPKSISLSTIVIHASQPQTVSLGITKGKIIAHAQMRAFDMVNLPSNYFTPEEFAQTAEKIAEEAKITVKVFRGQEVKKQKLEALWAVGKGSTNTPTFSILEYKPANATKTIGLVGKGVTFDTGGNNIKTQGMALMKCDMAGGAAVLAAVEAIAKLGLNVNVIGIVPACENSVDGSSYKPSDIINSYAGLTIEVEDTDAEGRLILADGLSYLTKNYKPDYIFDIATLTGASVITLGYAAGAMFAKSDETAEILYKIGMDTKEKLWRLPLWDEFADSLKSDIADTKNWGGSPAGCISAAKFLEKFTDKHPNWVHLDVAGVSFTHSDFSKDRSGTAFGVRIFTEFAEKIAE
jgi:leucyl aminopeptidase